MTKPDKEKNPTLSNLSNMADQIEILSSISSMFPSRTEQKLNELSSQIEIVRVAEKFNDLFKEKCWVLNDYLSAELLTKAFRAASENKFDEAEKILIESMDSGLSLFFMHLQTAPEFNIRSNSLETAKKCYEAGDYTSAIPLLFLAMDGIVNDINNIGLFAQNVDLDAWDSLTQYSEALKYVHVNFLTKTRKKTNPDPIFLPYRNGILHGRDINFGNKLLAAKCWNLLFVLRTWYRDKKDENYKKSEIEKNKNLSEKNRIMGKHLDAFKKRKYTIDGYSDISSPEYIINNFLNAWKNKQWGKIVPLMWHCIGKHQGKSAKNIKETYKNFNLQNYEIDSVDIETLGSANVLCSIYLEDKLKKIKHELNIFCSYSSQDLDPLPEGHPDGNWFIIQSSLTDVLFKEV